MRLTRPSWSAYALIMGRCCTGYTAISGGMPGMTHSYQTQMGCLRLLRDTNPPLVMAASRLKCHQKKCAGFVVEGVRNVRLQVTPVQTRREEALDRAVTAAFAGPARQTSHGHTTTHRQHRLDHPP